MGAGDRIPTLQRGALRSTAVALVASCCLAAPAGAAALPIGEPVDVGPVSDQLAAGTAAVEETASSVAAAGAAVGATGAADRGRPAVDAVVRGAAETVSGVAERVAPAVRRVTETPGVVTGPPTPVARDAAPPAKRAGGAHPRRAAHPVDGAGGGESARAARLQARRAEAARGSGSDSISPKAPGAAPPVVSTPGHDLAGAPPRAYPVAGAAHATPGRPAGRDPLPAAGGVPSASAAAAGFSLGGLALLLATLTLAGPALRRRLPSRPAVSWPAAFVPLLERPG